MNWRNYLGRKLSWDIEMYLLLIFISSEKFVLYSSDNVDHNICILDGKGTSQCWPFPSLKSLYYSDLFDPKAKYSISAPHLLSESSLICDFQRYLVPIGLGSCNLYTYRWCFFPITTMDPNDLTWIYPTLKFISSQAYNLCPVVSLDQPLVVVSLPELQPSVIRLGGTQHSDPQINCH